jgi:hypothetical protein
MMEELRIPHVSVKTSAGRASVEVDDDELRDLIEDHLVEVCGLDYEYLAPGGEGRHHALVFSPEVTSADIVGALNRLDPAEVERVFRLNNPRR